MDVEKSEDGVGTGVSEGGVDIGKSEDGEDVRRYGPLVRELGAGVEEGIAVRTGGSPVEDGAGVGNMTASNITAAKSCFPLLVPLQLPSVDPARTILPAVPTATPLAKSEPFVPACVTSQGCVNFESVNAAVDENVHKAEAASSALPTP